MVVGVLALALLLGFIVTAIATLRAAVYPRGSGILLLVAGGGFLFDFFVAGEWPPLAGQLDGAIVNMSVVAAFDWMGVVFWSGSGQGAP